MFIKEKTSVSKSYMVPSVFKPGVPIFTLDHTNPDIIVLGMFGFVTFNLASFYQTHSQRFHPDSTLDTKFQIYSAYLLLFL